MKRLCIALSALCVFNAFPGSRAFSGFLGGAGGGALIGGLAGGGRGAGYGALAGGLLGTAMGASADANARRRYYADEEDNDFDDDYAYAPNVAPGSYYRSGYANNGYRRGYNQRGYRR